MKFYLVLLSTASEIDENWKAIQWKPINALNGIKDLDFYKKYLGFYWKCVQKFNKNQFIKQIHNEFFILKQYTTWLSCLSCKLYRIVGGRDSIPSTLDVLCIHEAVKVTVRIQVHCGYARRNGP